MVRQVKKGILDLVGAARPSISDPFLPHKIQEGRLDDIRECIGCNICYAHDNLAVPIRCTQNPTMGEEYRRGWHPEAMPPKKSDDTILVVGAGPAGLEAARALGQRGYNVTLAEATTELGGRVAAESLLPGLTEWRRVIDYRIQQIKRMRNIDVFLDSCLTATDIFNFRAARVIVATGSRWRRDGVARWHLTPIGGFDGNPVFSPDDIMAGADLKGPVVLYDDDHYYMGGVLAEKMQLTGLQVSLVTSAGLVSQWCENTVEQERVQGRLLNLGVNIPLLGSPTENSNYPLYCSRAGRNITWNIDLIDIKALAGGDKPPPLRPRPSIYLKSSGGVYPRPCLVPVKRNRSDSVILFRGLSLRLRPHTRGSAQPMA
jgi:dimethylamine/trimethylamine dehydrogenase